MKTLLLTLSGPIGGYSSAPRLQHRLTQLEPTYSAVIGMIACALGIDRGQSIEHLKTLEMRVTAISGGEKEEDFQTIRAGVTYSGDQGRNVITTRHYVPDYCAEIELSGDDELMGAIEEALRFPRWQLYLGCRSNVIDRPVLGKAA